MDDFKVPTLPTSGASKLDTFATEQKNAETSKPVEKAPPATGACPYKPPKWSISPPLKGEYKFEVLKSGQIIETVTDLQEQPIWKFGRLPENDIAMAHPTISRFHAVLQYSGGVVAENSDGESVQSTEDAPPEGYWYIYDLNSTHGTFLNKQRVPPRTYIPMRVGHMLRLGGSTRSYILQGPAEDTESEFELNVTELRIQRQLQVAASADEKQRAMEGTAERERNEGISWGMSEDADEETDLTHNPYATTNNEELFLDDPKRTLRGFFEREGLLLEYKCDEMSTGSFVCRVELPVDDSNGRPIIAEVVHKGRKKECVVQCALEACRILDRHGVLRQANQEPQKRKVKFKDSDSDDDSFWDRTGDIERRKQRKANANVSITVTYDDLMQQEADVLRQMDIVEADILHYEKLHRKEKANKAALASGDGSDDLDHFMKHLNDGATQMDGTEIRKLRLEQQRLKAERLRLERLIKLAKPVDLQFGTKSINKTTDAENKTKVGTKQLPIVGKRNQFSKFKVLKTTLASTVAIEKRTDIASDEEELDNDEQRIEEQKERTIELKKVNAEVKKQYPMISVDTKQLDTSFQAESAVVTCSLKGQVGTAEHLCDSSQHKQNELSTIQSNGKNSEELNEQIIAKKRRSRQRQRKRHDVDNDELEEHETIEKYMKWMPPANQSGDGVTKLNDKYGY